MHHFTYRDNELYCEDVPVQKIAAEIGTPYLSIQPCNLNHVISKLLTKPLTVLIGWFVSLQKQTPIWQF